MYPRKKRLSIFLQLSLLILSFDQLTKWLAREFLTKTHEFFWGPLFIRFELAENSGAFLSLGANWPAPVRFWILTVFVSFILLYAAWSIFAPKNISSAEFWGYQLLLIGGLGNVIDRAYKGSVTDFVQVGISPFQTGIFNIVDMFIMAAFAITVWDLVFSGSRQKTKSLPKE